MAGQKGGFAELLCLPCHPSGLIPISFWFFRLSALIEWLSFFLFFCFENNFKREKRVKGVFICSPIHRYIFRQERTTIKVYLHTSVHTDIQFYAPIHICRFVPMYLYFLFFFFFLSDFFSIWILSAFHSGMAVFGVQGQCLSVC